MKTTLEIPDDVFRRSKATAALRGESLKDFVAAALRRHLDLGSTEPLEERGWRSVFGAAKEIDLEKVDAAVEGEFEQIDPKEWR